MKELVELITRSLVDHPDEIVIDEIEGDQATVYELRVAGDDLGKVIGSKGGSSNRLTVERVRIRRKNPIPIPAQSVHIRFAHIMGSGLGPEQRVLILQPGQHPVQRPRLIPRPGGSMPRLQ